MISPEFIQGVLVGACVALIVAGVKVHGLYLRLDREIENRDSAAISMRAVLKHRISLLQSEIHHRNVELAYANGSARVLAARVRELGGDA